MQGFDFRPAPRVVCGPGALARLGEIAAELGFRRTFLAADPGLMATPHVEAARQSLERAGVESVPYDRFAENPDTAMVAEGAEAAREAEVDSFVGIGGGSSLDMAKAVNFVVTNGGSIVDYWGDGKARTPLRPMIGVPTTAGTGSEAQRFALISDADTHVKMACGAQSARFRVAILDPELTVTQPTSVTATAGYDALAHAVETLVTTRRNPVSDLYAKEAYRLLSASYRRVLESPENVEARQAMQVGAYYAGVAIENSMLGATHACANPLTKRYGTPHGRAIALCLPWVVRFNADTAESDYRRLVAGGARALAEELEALRDAGGLPARLRDEQVPREDLAALADDAAGQWTGTFNPRAFDRDAALEIYECAY